MDFDPAPLFALSLLPYLLFLRWLQRSEALPELAVWGFRLTPVSYTHLTLPTIYSV